MKPGMMFTRSYTLTDEDVDAIASQFNLFAHYSAKGFTGAMLVLMCHERARQIVAERLDETLSEFLKNCHEHAEISRRLTAGEA